MTPYLLYLLYLILHLQKPHIISKATLGLIKLRPAVKVTDPRQVLILGSISSGTTQIANDLSHKLKLEIGHENAETSWFFVRDGTVSWFHGIRYLPQPANFQGVVHDFCRELHPSMGFHPFMYRNSKCSIREKWDPCWRLECIGILRKEWGCGLNNRCETPFRKVLHQVRHPLRTIESLVTKFCINGVEGELQRPFLVFSNALFPQHNFSDMSCIEAAGYYVYEYNHAIINANIDATYHIDDVTPCQVAKLAGFMEENHLYTICTDEKSKGNQLVQSKTTRYNKGQLVLDWDDLIGGKHGSSRDGDRDLLKRIKELALTLGYL